MRVELEVAGRRRLVEIERRDDRLTVRLDGQPVGVEATALPGGRWSLRLPGSGRQHEVVILSRPDGRGLEALVDGLSVPVRVSSGTAVARKAGAHGEGPDRVTAPMPGKVVKLLVSAGDQVTARQGVVVVEAMKMENELRAGRAGIVREVLVAEGASVEAGTPLLVIE
jgi:biotin carboxyl carrier protein